MPVATLLLKSAPSLPLPHIAAANGAAAAAAAVSLNVKRCDRSRRRNERCQPLHSLVVALRLAPTLLPLSTTYVAGAAAAVGVLLPTPLKCGRARLPFGPSGCVECAGSPSNGAPPLACAALPLPPRRLLS